MYLGLLVPAEHFLLGIEQHLLEKERFSAMKPLRANSCVVGFPDMYLCSSTPQWPGNRIAGHLST